MDFENDIKINKHELDVEWEKQPLLFGKYARVNAEATAERDRIWQRKKVTRAELMLGILEFCKKKELKKPTDVAIDAEIRANNEYKEGSEELITANEKVALTDATKWAIQQKRDALDNLVKLFLAGYWADSRIPKEAKELSDQKVTQRIKRSLRK